MKNVIFWGILGCSCFGCAVPADGRAAAVATEIPVTDGVLRFQFEGREAFLKKPEKALPGNPWVWRAYFPDWHTEIDSALLAKGYHVAYVNTSDMYGSPEAMAVWDRFYGYMTGHYRLASRVALEGVSRGGLYVHTWAKRNPTKVACIYAEAPVCDFTTWPEQDSRQEWSRLKEAYRFTSDAEAENYADMPIHQLSGLAALKVPVLHAVCNADRIVLPEKNTLAFGCRYIKQGGIFGVIPMNRTFNLETAGGHHFHLDNVDEIVAFIDHCCYPVKSQLSSAGFHQFNGTKVLRSKLKAEKGEPVNIVFLGGSITYNPGWRNHLEHYFRSRFPDARLHFHMAGIPSLGSVPHAFRYQTDVLDHVVPDILFYEAAVNDSENGYPVTDQQKSIEGIVRKTLTLNPDADIIMMHFADPNKLRDYSEGKVPEVIRSHNRIAEYYRIPVVDIAREITCRIANGEFSWEEDIKDLHPSVFGQEYYSASMKMLLDTLMAHTSGTTLPPREKLPVPVYKNCFDHAEYVRVDQAKGTFRWMERYVPDNGQSTREGFTDVPMLIGEKPGEKLTFSFSGNAVGVCVISGNDAGTIRYRVDGKSYRTVDLYTRWSSALHLPWYFILDDQLKRGKHKLELEIIPQKNPASKGNACRIVHFLVNH